MGLMWFSVGTLAVGAVWGMIELSKRHELGPLAWMGALGGVGVVLFGIAWTVASIFEGEPQAAALGAMTFGGLGVAILALTWRLLIAPAPSRVAADSRVDG